MTNYTKTNGDGAGDGVNNEDTFYSPIGKQVLCTQQTHTHTLCLHKETNTNTFLLLLPLLSLIVFLCIVQNSKGSPIPAQLQNDETLVTNERDSR